LNIQQKISLKPYNTFGIDVTTSEFVEVKSVEELTILCQAFNLIDRKLLVIGGGSNLLLTQSFDGMVIRNAIKGIEILSEDDNYVRVKAMSGEVWNDFVMWTVDRNYGGLENLSLIPGCVGAAPMQNIGAYGVEIKNSCESLEAISIESGNQEKFSKEECEFGYRESIFKNKLRGKYIIVSVTFKLSKKPVLNTTYGAIKQVLERKGIANPTVKDVSDAVIEIRTSKLPDPKKIGNSGSFFKNPEIPVSQYESLKQQYPDLVGYPAASGLVKVAAGWMIEQCGWKGKRVGNTGAHKDQALVLVNYGNATGEEIWQLALDIQQSVKDKFGVNITPEVNII
jgi:UDP-N-acetylmuramate dehydrogenase